jgi:AraC family transcriptional regulator
MSLSILTFGADLAEPITAYSSRLASAIALAAGTGDSHVYAVHLAAGGEIGPHRAGFDQLFLVVQGAGWVAGADGVRHALGALQAAFVPQGEIHAKGSDSGLVALMIQAREFMAPQVSRESRARSEYERRMRRVLEYIDAHLDRPLDLGTLAEVACFSAYHFHRLFAAWMGETLGDYVRRRRLELAAVRLAAQPRTRVLDVALGVGFGSAEAFARAFKSRFGCSPSVWRQRPPSARVATSNPGLADRKPGQAEHPTNGDAPVSPTRALEALMHVTLIDREPATLAGLRHVGPYGEPIARFWQEVYVPWAIRHRLGPAHARYGVSHDDPGITAPAQCRYDACAEVAADFAVDGDAIKSTLPGGRYAVHAFRGTVEEIGAAWSALLRDWLPASGLQLDARPCFEYYPRGAAHDPRTGEFECEICIPVAPL